jgi:BirA family transcriptional regulator, biotin operon repressor / biotin---[acetyl-CoA-carboxylase] ligase
MNELLATGGRLPDGFACVALAGSRFRGQRGRPWTALPGNLHLSLHLALDADAARHQVGLTVLPAVATARAIERLSEGRLVPRLKWVNDVWLDGHKVAGVLTAGQVHRGRLRHAVLGIGANVARAPDLPPSPRAAPATSLAAHEPSLGGPGGWARLLPLVLDEVDRGRVALLADAGADLLDAYRSRAAFLGRLATIWPVEEAIDGTADEPLVRGRVLALNDDLSLVIEGHPRPVHTGRMTLD